MNTQCAKNHMVGVFQILRNITMSMKMILSGIGDMAAYEAVHRVWSSQKIRFIGYFGHEKILDTLKSNKSEM